MSSNRSQRAERGPSGPLFFALALALFSTLPAFAADPLLNWIKSPEAYFATPEELARWPKEVVSAQDAEKFIDEYFRKRGEQFKTDLHTRMEFADSTFGLGETPGSRTAMGRVWIILGTPNEQKNNRTGATGAGMEGFSGRFQDNALERGARVTYTWIYKKDRLDAALGMTELKVDFNTDVQRGAQHIENPGLVEPYLRRAVANVSSKYAAGLTAHRAGPAHPPAEATPDPLWSLTPAPNGTIYTADAYVSPREQPLYAVSFFIPKGAPALKEWDSVLLVSLIRDASGKEVVSSRQLVDLQSYDQEGNRFFDRSYPLAPGKYDAVFAVYSPEGTTLLASQRDTFDIPLAGVSRATKLLLTSRVDTLDKQDALDPFTFVATKYAIRGDRKFRRTDKISFFTVISNPTGSPTPRLMQKMTFLRDGKSFAKTPPEPVEAMQTGPSSFLVGTTFDPGTFKAGHYALELRVIDMNAPDGSELRTKGYVLNAEFDVVE